MNHLFQGVGTALVTPFNANMSIDWEGLDKLVNYQIAGNTSVLVVQGTTGESPTLSWDEKLQILERVMQVNAGRKKIVFGLGGNNTADILAKIKTLPAGVDGILSVSPYYNKPIQKGIVNHFKMIAAETDLPIILYNVPGRTGSNMSVETTLELAEVKNIVAIKEASGNMEQIMDILRQKPSDFGVISGDDLLTFPLILAGACGVISVVSNAFPAEFSKMVAAALKGDVQTAREIHYQLFEITQLFFQEGNPGGVKESLKMLNLMQNFMRPPLHPVSNELAGNIHRVTKSLVRI